MAVELIPLNPDQHVVTFIPKLSAELPFFNLTSYKRGLPSPIKFDGLDEYGHPIHWEVFPNFSKEIGAPGVEAHRVWYLLIKPAIDEARELNGKVPQVIPLGRVRECIRKVGWSAGGRQERDLVQALRQIGFAGCIADLWVPTKEQDDQGRTKYIQLKGSFSRMSIYAIGEHHLTEEELQSASFNYDLEDIIYIKLDPLEAKLQEAQDQRIYDNEYLFSVNPAARRWYELLAPKIFGVVKNKGAYCEIRYSWYVKHHHTLKRFYERREVVKQMQGVVKDHLTADYITKVEYRKVKEADQELDFIIRYYPGEGAKESIARIQGHIYHKKKQLKETSANLTETYTETKQGSVEQPILETLAATLTEEEKQLIRTLNTEFEIAITTAHQLVKDNPEAVKAQLAYWPSRSVNFHTGKAGWMITAIKQNYAPASNWQEQKQQQEAKNERQAQVAKRESQKAAYEQYRSDTLDNYISEHAGEYEAILEAQMARFRKTSPNPLLQGMARNEISQRIELLTYETYCAQQQPSVEPITITTQEAPQSAQDERTSEQGSVTQAQAQTTIQEPPAQATEPAQTPHHNTQPSHLL